MAEKKTQIPIGSMMKAIDQADTNFYKNLSKDQQKAFSPWLAMRWASSVRSSEYSPHYLTIVNDWCNQDFSTVSKHPELFWKLLTIAGLGATQNHSWIPPAKKAKKSKVQKFLADHYPSYSSRDLEMLEKINTLDDIKELAKSYGYDKKEIKEMLG
jgi:hypothetical protein